MDVDIYQESSGGENSKGYFASENDKDTFYRQLRQQWNKASAKELRMILGDFNVKRVCRLTGYEHVIAHL